MRVEVKRQVVKKVEEVVEFDVRKYWVVRIIQDKGCKTCIAEKEFYYVPAEQEIADMLVLHNDGKCFATVEENYKLVEVEE